MFRPWITLLAKDIHINLPLSMEDRNVDIIFKNLEAVNDAIMQLQRIREMYLEKEAMERKADDV